jgi:hypothetical protein
MYKFSVIFRKTLLKALATFLDPLIFYYPPIEKVFVLADVLFLFLYNVLSCFILLLHCAISLL